MATPFSSKKNPRKSMIKAYIRVRPLVEKEINLHCARVLSVNSKDNQISIDDDDFRHFTYDGVCDEFATQESVYLITVKPLLKHLKDGHNVNVIAYGQTGSGKTYTIGTDSAIKEGSSTGILQRVALELFSSNYGYSQDNVDDEAAQSLELKYVEIYQKRIFDLLAGRKELATKPDGHGGVIPLNCKEVKISQFSEILSHISEGNALRSVTSTVMNSHSSRSHAIISISCKKKDFGCLRLVDLAGAEGVGKNQMEGRGFSEGVNINQGLLTVGKVLAALSSGVAHIPYRDSLLTQLLKDALGGSNYTSIIGCVSPSSDCLSVTLNTLRYTEQARNIRNKPIAVNSTIKRPVFKRRVDDPTATPGAFKRFKEMKIPTHNSTISTPGHKPPESKKKAFNSSFVTTPFSKCLEVPKSRYFQRTSSQSDISSIAPLKAPIFEEDSPSNFAEMGRTFSEITLANATIPISPLVNRMNSQLEQSMMMWERRMKDQMEEHSKRMEDRLAKLFNEGKRHSRRLQSKMGILLDSPVEDDDDAFSKVRCRITETVKQELNDENKAKLDEFIFKKPELLDKSNFYRNPLAEVSNYDSNKPHLNGSFTDLPVTSTAMRKSTRLSTRQSIHANLLSDNLNLGEPAPIQSEHNKHGRLSLLSSIGDCEDRMTLIYAMSPDLRNINKKMDQMPSIIVSSPNLDKTMIQRSSSPLMFDRFDSLAYKAPVRRSTRVSAHNATLLNHEILNLGRRCIMLNETINKTANHSFRTKGNSILMPSKPQAPQLVMSAKSQKKLEKSLLSKLNKASLKELQMLPTVGPKTAMVLKNYRDSYGKFKSVHDLKNVHALPKSYYARFIKSNLMTQIGAY